MKILYFTAKVDPLYASNWSMVYALEEYTDVKYFGLGGPLGGVAIRLRLGR